MAYIYKITNLINGKSYIGKTLSTINERWNEHCRSVRRKCCEKRPLYSAMNKYGIDNFKIEQIEECNDDIVNEREVYWIEYFGTFKNGYNATIGGDGKHYLDYDLICETYKQVQNIVKTAEICGCCVDSVRNILRERHIPVLSSQEISKIQLSKMVNQYSLNNEYLRSFSSLSDAAQYLIDNKLTNCKKSTIRTHISEVCRGKRKTAAKFKWTFKN